MLSPLCGASGLRKQWTSLSIAGTSFRWSRLHFRCSPVAVLGHSLSWDLRLPLPLWVPISATVRSHVPPPALHTPPLGENRHFITVARPPPPRGGGTSLTLGGGD